MYLGGRTTQVRSRRYRFSSPVMVGAALVGGYLLAYEGLGPWPPQQTPAAFWLASSFALALLSVILPLILWRAVRSYRPAA